MSKTRAHRVAERMRKAHEWEINPHAEEAHAILHALTMDPDVGVQDAYNYIVEHYPTTHIAYTCTQLLREYDGVAASVLNKTVTYLKREGKGDSYLTAQCKTLEARVRKLKDAAYTSSLMRQAWERDIHKITTHDTDGYEIVPKCMQVVWADPQGRIKFDDGTHGPTAAEVAGCARKDPRSYMVPKQHIRTDIRRHLALNSGIVSSTESLKPTRRGKGASERRRAQRAQRATSGHKRTQRVQMSTKNYTVGDVVTCDGNVIKKHTPCKPVG